MTATESGCSKTLTDSYTLNVVCPCTLTSSISAGTSYSYDVNAIEATDSTTQFTTSGASCGTVTHALSHDPDDSGIFSINGNYGYKWQTNDPNLVKTYTVTITATENGCNTSLQDLYSVVVACPCTLTSSFRAGLSYTYNVNSL